MGRHAAGGDRVQEPDVRLLHGVGAVEDDRRSAAHCQRVAELAPLDFLRGNDTQNRELQVRQSVLLVRQEHRLRGPKLRRETLGLRLEHPLAERRQRVHVSPR